MSSSKTSKSWADEADEEEKQEQTKKEQEDSKKADNDNDGFETVKRRVKTSKHASTKKNSADFASLYPSIMPAVDLKRDKYEDRFAKIRIPFCRVKGCKNDCAELPNGRGFFPRCNDCHVKGTYCHNRGCFNPTNINEKSGRGFRYCQQCYDKHNSEQQANKQSNGDD